MSVHPRLRPLLALQARIAEDPDVTHPARRLAGTLQARRLGRLVMHPGPKVPTREVMVPVDGGAIRVRLYEPADAPGRRPLHVFFHGGGWCQGDLDQRDPRCRTVAAEAGCTVASVDYRLAPENAFPTPLHDCYDALCWLVDRADQLGVDPARVSVGGESAGANLAAVVCLMARDRSGPSIVFQWLDVPAVDLTMSMPSIDRLATGYSLTRDSMERYVAAYLRDHDPRDPLASPLFAEDHAGLPPAFITTVEYDPLTDEGHAYAAALRAAGVPVEHEHLRGLVHPSFAFTRLLPEARDHEQRAIAALRRGHAGTDDGPGPRRSEVRPSPAPLLELVPRSAAVVGIGEAAHFVSEFNRLRADMVERLVADHQVTHLALEVGPDEAPAIESWLRRDRDGRLADLIGELSYILYGSFLVELRERLDPRHGVGVIGVDLPNSLTLEPSLAPLAELLSAIDPDATDLVDSARRAAAGIAGGSAAASAVQWMGLRREDRDELTVTLARLAGRITALGPVHAGSDREGAWRRAGDLIEAATTTDLLLRAMAELFSGEGRTADTTLREQFVASRILHAVEHFEEVDGRIAYVAHNNHIQKTPVVFDGALAAYPAGMFLAQTLGERYVSIALTHLGSEVPEMAVPADNAVGFDVEIVPVEPPRADSIEQAAAEASIGDVTIVRPSTAHGRDVAIASIRSQSAVSDISSDAFDAAVVVPHATMDPAVAHLGRSSAEGS